MTCRNARHFVHGAASFVGVHAQIVFRVWVIFREQEWVTFRDRRGRQVMCYNMFLHKRGT